MLTKLITQSDEVRLVLTVDESVLEAQVVAARYLVDEELGAREGAEFIDGLIAASKAAAGTHSEFVSLLLELRSIGSVLLDKVLTDEERSKAVASLEETLSDEDVRQSLAYVRAQASLAQYRESSNIIDLLDPDPVGASWVTIRPVSTQELRRVESAAGPRPRLGALHHSHAADRARREARRGGDSVDAFATYLAGLSQDEQRAVEAFEDWQLAIDQGVFSAAVQSIDGFELERNARGYPVEEFVAQCPEAQEVIAEIARASIQVGRLGKADRLLSFSQPGTLGHDDEQQASQTGGTAGNVSEDGSQLQTG